MSEFPIVPAKTALLFFDTLNHYLNPDDPKERAEVEALGVIPRMQRINAAARAAGISVFYAAADHRPDHRDFAPLIVDYHYDGKAGEKRGRVTPPPPVSVAGPNREVIAQIAPQPADYLIKKHRWSTFFQTHFELSLRTAGINTIMMAGGSVEVGIASTAYAARDLDFNQIILRDACTSGKPDVMACFLDRIFPVFCRVMTVDEAIAQFASAAKA
jgi:ureidoacrylate peracid hydrolase